MSYSIQKAFYYLTFRRYEMIVPNAFVGDNEMDFCCIRKSGYVDEIEMKVTKSDFLADFKKTSRVKIDNTYCIKNKHEAIAGGYLKSNHFSFLVPEELQKELIIPEYAGLYTFSKSIKGLYRIKEVKKPKMLHKRKISDKSKYLIVRKLAYRYWDSIK